MKFVALFVLPVFVPAIAALVLTPLAMLTRSPARRRASLIALWCATALILSGVGFWTWFFRDGVGPGMHVSSGSEAWGRFWADYWFVAALALALPIAASQISRISRE